MSSEAVVVIAVVIVMAVVVILLVRAREKRRAEAMQAAAYRVGLAWSPELAPGIQERLAGFRLVSQGYARKASNVLHGTLHSIDVTLFDYQYRTGSGKHSHFHNQTVLSFETDRLRLPAFTLRPEHLFHKLGQALGYQDIDFEANPEFSAAYLLQGPDEDAIRAAFDEVLLGYFVRHPGLCVEGAGAQLICYRAGRVVDADQLGAFLEEGLDVLDALTQKEGGLGIPLTLIGLGGTG